MIDHAFLSIFTPSRTRPEDLEAIFVQRQDMLEDAVARVRESATTHHKHHLLFVGPRGTGKTHLVTLLVHRINQDDSLNGLLRVAWLNEDETSTTLLELLQRIYIALGKRYPDEYREASLEQMFDLEAEEAERWLADLLLRKLKDHTLLVVVENLDALFGSLGKLGQQKLRAFIQEHPVLSIVATAQRLVDDISKRKSAFFGFFQTEQLKVLSVEQAAELLGNIATLSGQGEVASFLRSTTGRSRVRALHHLSGGNHRIYIVLSQFITRANINDLVEPFSKMIDEMTPYYQERIRWLPPQQRKIVEYLCSRDRPAPVKMIARRLFATQQTISSQLKDLRKKGYVQAAQRGRESLYEITEPLMRICVEVKENQANGPLRILVDFLRIWYDGEELNSRQEACKSGGMARAYLESAIKRNTLHGNLRKKLLVEGFRAELGDEKNRQWSSRIESYVTQSEALGLACGEWAKGNDAKALATLKEITDGRCGDLSPGVKAQAWLLACAIHLKNNSDESAIESLGFLVDLEDAPVDLVAKALKIRGMILQSHGDTDKANADFSMVINMTDALTEDVVEALYFRGGIYWVENSVEKSAADFKTLLCLDGASVKLRVDAHITLAEIHINDGRWSAALETLTNGLKEGKDQEQPYLSDSTEVVGAFFESSLTPRIMQERIQELARVYRDNGATSQLGEALIKHLGVLYCTEADLPSPESLERWTSTWEEAFSNVDAFQLSQRIFRTGIDFLKSGGKDQNILLDLNQEERKILEQALCINGDS